MNIINLREHLKNFQFPELFVELGWSWPEGPDHSTMVHIKGHQVPCSRIAEISGVPVLKFKKEVWDKLSNTTDRKKFHKAIKDKVAHQHLVLFSDDNSFFEISYLSKQDHPRKHSYFKGQSGDYFISKLTNIHFGIEDEPKIKEIGEKLEKAFDTEKVTKRFYEDFKANHFNFQKYISGIKNEEEKKWYASLILNRLMFIYFLQKKGFVNSDFEYLQTKLSESKQRGKDRYYSEFLTCLFFEGFAKKPIERSEKAKQLLGKIKYLNGGLFVPHALEEKYALSNITGAYKTKIKIQDKAFEETFDIFAQYDWCLQGKEGKSDNEISHDVMGYIFEKYINELQQKELGAYYTKDEITEYLSRNTIQKTVLEKIKQQGYKFKDIEALLHRLTPSLCKKLLTDEDSILNTLTVLDPAVGSGAFLVSAMKELRNIYNPIIVKINKTCFEKGVAGEISSSYNKDLKHIKKWLEDFKGRHKSLDYGINKNIILKNLYGVDIMKEAVEVCKLRLFLYLVSSALDTSDLEPLPNMDFNILCGNSLIGFLREPKAEDTQIAWSEILGESYEQIKAKYNQLVSRYKNQPLSFAKLKELKQKTTRFLKEHNQKLNLALAVKCQEAGVKYPEIVDIQGKKKITKKRAVRPEDFSIDYNPPSSPKLSFPRTRESTYKKDLNPFHWDFAFNEIMARGGFDCILTNPPWEKVKTEDREFFHKHDPSIDKKKTSKEAVKAKKKKLLKSPKIANDYKKTEENYLFQRTYFSGLYKYQIGLIYNADGTDKQASSDIETYRLFTERCLELLDKNGFLGAVLPSGLCKDDGAIGLRKDLLFSKTQIKGLIDFQNQLEKGQGKIFEGVHPQFKFLLLNLQKTIPSKNYEFPCHFHTRSLKVLEHFPPKSQQQPEGKSSFPCTRESTDQKSNPAHKEANYKETTSIAGRSEVVWQSIKEIKQLSPRDSAIIEFKNAKDRAILKKASQFQAIGKEIKSTWNPVFYTEFHETNDAHLFKNKIPQKSVQQSKKNDKYLPLYKGSAIYQYEYNHALHHVNRYVSTKAKKVQQGKGLAFRNQCYKNYRLVIRTIARSTDERSLISAVIPKNHFIANNFVGVHIASPLEAPIKAGKNNRLFGSEDIIRTAGSSREKFAGEGSDPSPQSGSLDRALFSDRDSVPSLVRDSRVCGNDKLYMLLLQAFFNSFVVDYFVRQKISSVINQKYLTPLRIPRLTEKDDYFKELVTRSAKLTCIGKEFNELADEVGIPRGGVQDQEERWKIQGEIDAMVAKKYDLSSKEFEYILSTFTTGKNQERLNALKKYALSAFQKDQFLNKAS